MPSKGGRYVIRNGKRELVHNTQPAPAKPVTAATKQPAAPVKTDAAPKPAKAAAKQEVDTNE